MEDAATADPSGIDLALFSIGADRLPGAGPAVSPPPGPWSSTTPRPGAWTPRSPWSSPRSTATRWTSIPKGIVANPNCTTMVAMPVLKPLHDAAGLARLVVATYQAVSGAGLAGVAELDEQLRKSVDDAAGLTFDGRSVHFPPASVFPDTIAHNVVPMAGHLVDDGSGETSEEQKFAHESRKILGIPDLAVTCTCVRVPVFTGHSLAIVAEFAATLSPERGHRRAGPAPRGSGSVDVPTPCTRPGPTVTWWGASAGPRAPARAGPVRERRQPAQGCGPQRRPDRRGAGRALGPRRLSRRVVGIGPDARPPAEGRWSPVR